MKPSEILQRLKRRLPHTTQRIIQAIGWSAARRFLKLNGQREVYIPPRYKKSHPLFEGLTPYQARRLVNEFGGENIKLPSYKKMLASERYSLIMRDYMSGYEIDSLAVKYRMTERSIHDVVKRFGIKRPT